MDFFEGIAQNVIAQIIGSAIIWFFASLYKKNPTLALMFK